MASSRAETERLRAVVMDVDGTLYRQAPVRGRMAMHQVAHLAAHPLRGWRVVHALRHYRRAQEHLRASGGPASDQVKETASATGYATDWVEATMRCWMDQMPLARFLTGVF